MRHCLQVLLAVALALVLVAATSRAETLRLRADAWMPYNGDPQGKYPGYAIEIARAILAKHAIDLDYQTMTWGDALAACAAGQIEAVVGANTTEAEKLVVPAETIGKPKVGLFVLKKNSWSYENVPSLARIHLGVIQDYKYFDTLDDYVARHHGREVVRFGGEKPLESAIQKLVDGEIDVLAEVYPVFAWTARNAGLKGEQFRLAYLHEAEPVYFAFLPGPAGKRYANLFDEGLRELRASGELQKILKRYGQEEWKD